LVVEVEMEGVRRAGPVCDGESLRVEAEEDRVGLGAARVPVVAEAGAGAVLVVVSEEVEAGVPAGLDGVGRDERRVREFELFDGDVRMVDPDRGILATAGEIVDVRLAAFAIVGEVEEDGGPVVWVEVLGEVEALALAREAAAGDLEEERVTFAWVLVVIAVCRLPVFVIEGVVDAATA